MDKNKAFALYGVNMIKINGYDFKYANGYTIINVLGKPMSYDMLNKSEDK